jgi:hypothetical protein
MGVKGAELKSKDGQVSWVYVIKAAAAARACALSVGANTAWCLQPASNTTNLQDGTRISWLAPMLYVCC